MKIEYYTKYIKVYIAPYADNKLIENLENSIEWLSNKLSIQLRGTGYRFIDQFISDNDNNHK